MSEHANAISGDGQARGMADAVARRSYGKLVALLAARTGDLAAAEDALSEAFVSALENWPLKGCPSNPEAWLLSVARRKVIDLTRRRRTHEIAVEQLELRAEWLDPAAADAAIPDHRLALMFACAHPAIEPFVRAPLILQVVLGLNAATIASAFLMSPATMGQRLVRAKNKIKQAGIPFRIPEREELAGRLDAVLDAIYATFAEGWTDPGGTDVARRDLAEEALFLGRIVTELLPQEPEALGLLALMLHAEARRRARRNAQGEYVPLAEQDTSLWDSQMIDAAEALLLREHTGRHRPISTRRCFAIGARASPPHGSLQLAGGRAALRRTVDPVRITGGRDQSRPGNCGDARRRRRSPSDGRDRCRFTAHRIPALLGRTRGTTGQDRGKRRSAPRVRNRHRSRTRCRGPPLLATAPVGVDAATSSVPGL